MRRAETEYWDRVAEATNDNGVISDNWLKRQLLGQFLLKCSWIRQRVLEIGCGNCVTAAMLALSCGRIWEYTGTDLSDKWVTQAREQFGFNVVQADVLNLPKGEFTRILALDSLEHVRPEDREEGYKQIAARLAPQGLMFINMPRAKSGHVEEFDYGIGLRDLMRMEEAGLILKKYEVYNIQFPDHVREYAFAVLTK